MPLFVREKCDCCDKWDWYLLRSDGKYYCTSCKEKVMEIKFTMFEELKEAHEQR